MQKPQNSAAVFSQDFVMAIHVVIFKIIKDGKDRNQKLHFATNTQGSTLAVVKQAGGGGIINVLTSAGSLRLNHVFSKLMRLINYFHNIIVRC